MSKIYKPENRFTIIPNELIEDASLSLKAKGVYAVLVSKPDGWTYYETQLVNECSDGVTAFRNAMRELVDGGWVFKIQEKNEAGKFAHNSFFITDKKGLFYDTAKTVDGKPDNGKTVDGKQHTNKTNNNKTNLSKTNKLPPTPKKNKKAPVVFDSPLGVTIQTWEDFIQHRSGIRKPLTEVSVKHIIKKLETMSQEGNDPEEVLKRSIVNGWQGIFPLQRDSNKKSDTQTITEQLRRMA